MSVGSKNPRQIFLAAVKLPFDQRDSYLVEACAGDESLRRRVAELVKSHEEIGSFLDAPPAVTDAIDSPVSPPQFGEGTQIGPYKLLQQIGEGGMGVVYMAEQQKPVRRRVALKIIKPGMDSRQVIARFEAERQALAMMDHPEHCPRAGRRLHRKRPALLRHGIGAGHPHHPILRRQTAQHHRAAGAFHPGLPRRPARTPKGHHPPRSQTVERAGDDLRRQADPQDHRLWRRQGAAPAVDREDVVHPIRRGGGNAGIYEPRTGGDGRAGHRHPDRRLLTGRAAL